MGHEAARFESISPAHAVGEAGVVRDDDEGGAGDGVGLQQQIGNALAGGGVERTGRLVGEDEFGLVDERARDGGAELLAAGDLPRQMRHADAETDLFEERLGARARRGRSFVPTAGEAGHQDVFKDRALREQVVQLKNETDGAVAESRRRRRVETAERRAVDRDRAGGRLIERTEEIEKRGLAAARGADDGDRLRGGDAQIEFTQDSDGGRRGSRRFL